MIIFGRASFTKIVTVTKITNSALVYLQLSFYIISRIDPKRINVILNRTYRVNSAYMYLQSNLNFGLVVISKYMYIKSAEVTTVKAKGFDAAVITRVMIFLGRIYKYLTSKMYLLPVYIFNLFDVMMLILKSNLITSFTIKNDINKIIQHLKDTPKWSQKVR